MSTTDDLAAEIAAHQPTKRSAWGTRVRCFQCAEPWPCLVRRLADRMAALLAALLAVAQRVVAAYDEYPEGNYPDPDDVFDEIRGLGRALAPADGEDAG